MRNEKKVLYKVLKVLILIIVLICISFTNGANRKVTLFENLIGRIIEIPQRAYVWIDKTFIKNEDVGTIESLEQEKTKLSEEIASLKKENIDYQLVKSENEDLKKQLNVKSQYDDKNMVVANIISVESNNWDEIYIIDKGYNDGIKPRDTVISNDGLVGYIYSCTDSTSKVVAIIDATSNFSVRATKTGEEISAKGDLKLKEVGCIRISSIPKGVVYSSGDTIETSGIGGIYPKGIMVGTVESFIKHENPSENEAIVKAFVDFNRLEIVAIIVEDNK
jgi:rod shape-determining protein MreC